MTQAPFILASQSRGRADMLRNAGLMFNTAPAHVDEAALMTALCAEGLSGRNIADALAEAKAIKVSLGHPGALVLGADQILVGDDAAIFCKPADQHQARAQLTALSGRRHQLFSAAVVVQDGQAVWRHIGEARLWVRDLSDAFISDYVEKYWDRIRWTVGCYEVEGAGVQLFDKVEGDPWTIIGLPMLPLLAWLRLRGMMVQ